MSIVMSDLSGVLRDARTNEIASFLHVSTQAARESIDHQTTQWTSTSSILEKRSSRARCLKSALHGKQNSLRGLFLRLGNLEPIVREFLTAPSELEEEGYSQLFFRGEALSVLNNIPRLLGIWTFLKLTIFPLMSVVMPLAAIIGPFIVVKYIMGMPLTFGQYLTIAQNMYFGKQGESTDMFSNMKRIMQLVLFCITSSQSIYQPIQSARHLRKIDVTVQEKGKCLQEFITICEEIRREFTQLGIKTPLLPVPIEIRGDIRRIVMYALERPEMIGILLQWVGSWDVAVAIAEHSHCVPVEWITLEKKEPYIYIANTCDTRIEVEKQLVFTIRLGGRDTAAKHALLTGPNRGGKSTVLRALLRSVVMAHTYGIGIGSRCIMTPLDWVQSSLRMEDLPGSESFFEREVHFARDSLRKPIKTRGLVCIDELFHSTNPPDAEAASREYLAALWEKKNIVSVVSTHIFSIVHSSPTNIARLCCPATISADGTVKYMYGLASGICEVSSVREIIGDAFSQK